MTSSKYIISIIDNKIYIVNCDILRDNWRNEEVAQLTYSYKDSIKESSMMTKFNIDFFKSNACKIIELDNEDKEYYNKWYSESIK